MKRLSPELGLLSPISQTSSCARVNGSGTVPGSVFTSATYVSGSATPSTIMRPSAMSIVCPPTAITRLINWG